jgi:hypothetical protein
MSSEFELEPQPKSGGSSGKALLIVLGVVGGLGLVCAGVVTAGFIAIIALGQNASATFQQVSTRVDADAEPTFTKVSNRIERQPQERVPADRVVDQFLDDIRADRFPAAYDRTSRAYQARTSQAAFANFIQSTPSFQRLNGMELRGKKIDGTGHVICSVTPQGAPTVELHLVEEDGLWKIDDLVREG